MGTDADRQAQLLSLWLQRPPGKRTRNDVLAFYGALKDTPLETLLKKGKGDEPYHQLFLDLCGYFEE